MKILCVIPSRIGSTRIPRKPLLPILGKPMIQWTLENAMRCKAISKVIVATDSEEIGHIVEKAGGLTMMTDPAILTGSDRVAAVAATHPDMDVVINLQGDEPFVKPSMLEQLVAPYLNGEMPEMTTLASTRLLKDYFTDPGRVKVITDLQHNALYFSRSPIPFYREHFENVPVYHHIGLYAFRRDFLLRYQTLPQTPLEKVESLEQLRALEHGFKIRVCLTEETSFEVNTQEEYEQALQFAELDY